MSLLATCPGPARGTPCAGASKVRESARAHTLCFTLGRTEHMSMLDVNVSLPLPLCQEVSSTHCSTVSKSVFFRPCFSRCVRRRGALADTERADVRLPHDPRSTSLDPALRRPALHPRRHGEREGACSYYSSFTAFFTESVVS